MEELLLAMDLLQLVDGFGTEMRGIARLVRLRDHDH